jgi:hypothetical protein
MEAAESLPAFFTALPLGTEDHDSLLADFFISCEVAVPLITEDLGMLMLDMLSLLSLLLKYSRPALTDAASLTMRCLSSDGLYRFTVL